MLRKTAMTAAATLATAASLVAAPALAAPGDHGQGRRVAITGHDGFIVATCADGGVVTGPMEGYVTMLETLDDAGNLLMLRLTMEYKMTWTLSTTGESLYPHGTRHLVFDYVDGTFTESGTIRTLTVAGEGAVLKYAGHEVRDLGTFELISKAGPDLADIGDPDYDNDLVCGLFGQEGA